MYGSGVPADNEAAAKWLRRAAASGHPHAGRYLEIIADNAASLERAKRVASLKAQIEKLDDQLDELVGGKDA